MPLRNFVGRIDMIQTLAAILIALMHSVHPQVARSSLRIGAAALADSDRRGPCKLNIHPPLAVCAADPQPIQVCDREARQALIALVAKIVTGTLQQLVCGGAAERLLHFIHFGKNSMSARVNRAGSRRRR